MLRGGGGVEWEIMNELLGFGTENNISIKHSLAEVGLG